AWLVPRRGDTRTQMPWRDSSGARVRRQGQGGVNSTANKLVVFFKTKTSKRGTDSFSEGVFSDNEDEDDDVSSVTSSRNEHRSRSPPSPGGGGATAAAAAAAADIYSAELLRQQQ
ncbi:unnamed protein product, partial [Ectocarpus sp. 12 AP-2014]